MSSGTLGTDNYKDAINTTAAEHPAHNCLYTNTINCPNNSAGKSDRSLKEIYDKYVDVKTNTGANVKAYASEDLVYAYRRALNRVALGSTTQEGQYTGNQIRQIFDNIQKDRDELDIKLETAYNLPGSVAYEYKSHYESTLMSGVLWGTLAITMVYYVFYKK